jgi:hypothetical protein
MKQSQSEIARRTASAPSTSPCTTMANSLQLGRRQPSSMARGADAVRPQRPSYIVGRN